MKTSSLSTSIACFLSVLTPSIWATENFDSVPKGRFTTLETQYGTMTAAAGVAEISGGGRNNSSALRFFGGQSTELKLKLKEKPKQDTAMSAWAERWTNAAPFAFSITAEGAFGSKEIYNGDREIKTGGVNSRIKAEIPAQTETLVFRVTSPANKGARLDDLSITPTIPMKLRVKEISVSGEVTPIMARLELNPTVRINVPTEGCLKPIKLIGVVLNFEGENIADIESVSVYRGGEEAPAVVGNETTESLKENLLGTTKGAIAKGSAIIVNGEMPLDPNENYLWVSVKLKENAKVGSKILVNPTALLVKSGSTKRKIEINNTKKIAQRTGAAVVKPGDFKSKFYRIPGLARSKKGTLLAVYDIRYDHSGDLPANIDVGCSRSTDGGQTWSDVSIAMDDSDLAPTLGATKGVGDPAILIDESTGRIWVAALWSHRHSIGSSKAGSNDPMTCGQLALVYSDDDGITWSKPINITEQTKKLEWKILFYGPGAGICLKDGTLVFAAQYWDSNGVPWSTIVYSKDKGKTWHCGTGVHQQTTEAQVAELADGSLMINARCNFGGSRVVGVTRDLGKTWTLHTTNRKPELLAEPVCQGSLLALDKGVAPKRMLLFSNPNTGNGRRLMTVKMSADEGETWPKESQLLYDSRRCWGYSCLAPVDKEHVGVLYESAGSLFFLKIPYREITGNL